MTGIETDEVDELVRDVIGEMANMIAGAGKRHLEPLSLQLDIPRVLVNSPADAIPVWPHHHWVPLETDFGRCTLDVGFVFPILAEVA
jgi:CheY-specific phosphatase CheX